MKSNKKLESGIYLIRNKKNKKSYIGSAVNIKGRWRTHRSGLKHNKHHNRFLQRSWNKYGEESFEFSVLEYCDKEELIAKEQNYLDKLNPEYNLSPTAKNCLGVKHTNPVSNYKRGSYCRGKFGKDSKSSIPIYQYDKEGNFLKKWYGGAEIERELGYSQSNIRKACNKKNWTPYGFYWTREYMGDKINPVKIRNRDSTCKKIGMFSQEGKLIREFKSQKEAVEFIGKSSNSCINCCLKGKLKRGLAYGYRWKYI